MWKYATGFGIYANICPESEIIFTKANPMIDHGCNGYGFFGVPCLNGAISLSELKQTVGTCVTLRSPDKGGIELAA